jgi:hypothetical protein
MFSALSILGKIAEFLANELQSITIARATDKRGQACAALTRLYYLLVELESLTDEMQSVAEHAVASNVPELLAYRYQDVQRRIARFTNDFVETFTQLEEVLKIFAPEVAAALVPVSHSKCNLLWELSQFVVIETDGEGSPLRKVTYLKPDERLLNLDIGAFAERLKSGQAQERAERFEWPDRLLFYGDVEGSFSSEELTFVENSEVCKFANMLKEHSQVLSTGIHALKDYIKSTFRLDEVLYERVKINPGWFF